MPLSGHRGAQPEAGHSFQIVIMHRMGLKISYCKIFITLKLGIIFKMVYVCVYLAWTFIYT